MNTNPRTHLGLTLGGALLFTMYHVLLPWAEPSGIVRPATFCHTLQLTPPSASTITQRAMRPYLLRRHDNHLRIPSHIAIASAFPWFPFQEAARPHLSKYAKLHLWWTWNARRENRDAELLGWRFPNFFPSSIVSALITHLSKAVSSIKDGPDDLIFFSPIVWWKAFAIM